MPDQTTIHLNLNHLRRVPLSCYTISHLIEKKDKRYNTIKGRIYSCLIQQSLC
jgi:hypothetical protein